ncbi:hypothetical protein UB31_00580 [Bradyrhizobium sp. LTSP849]|uniref:hypothetical protein n=1 Tax=Bradyrhizobium sp. LTSP849 TaxID=1615890 RepID=UPI0005D1FE47|nr:hypothetical protein [Bradyrhizobium sp. LTSP849]KJC55508.1 hypothetical protein UB31_00580 [Bradyrhizobium sp. LTSP849]
MARKTRRSSDRRSIQNDEGPFLTKHPFSGVPSDVIRSAIGEVGAKAAAELPNLQQQLRGMLLRCEPTYFLANMAQSYLFASIARDGTIDRPKYKDGALQQFHLEFAQAAFLTIDPSDLQPIFAHPKDIQDISDKLSELLDAYKESRFAMVGEAQSKEEQYLIALQERVRLHTLAVRNWGYYEPALNILRGVFGPLDDHCARLVGLTAKELISAFDILLRATERESASFRHKLAAAFTCKSKRQMIEEYHR